MEDLTFRCVHLWIVHQLLGALQATTMKNDIYWPGVCGNSSSDWAFWSDKLSWNTRYPGITLCFQKTVLQWLPCGMLWIVSPAYLAILCRKKKIISRRSKLNIFKIILCLFLAVISLIDLIKAFIDGSNTEKVVPVALFIYPAIEFITMMLNVLLIRLERLKGIVSSGCLFIFWFLQMICHAFIFASQTVRLKEETDVFLSVTALISSVLVFIQFLAHCFADQTLVQIRLSEEEEPLLSRSSMSISSQSLKLSKPCPEMSASFLSRITFLWIIELVYRGRRRKLTSADVWDLRPQETSEVVIPKVEKEWKTELTKSKGSTRKMNHQNTKGVAFTERQTGDTNESVETQDMIKDPKQKKYSPSLFMALARVYGWFHLYAGLIRLISEMLNFIQPQILRSLIDFVSSGSPYKWHGYVFAVGLYLVAMARTLTLQQHLHSCFAIGIRVRTAVIALVYRKALLLSGASMKVRTVGEIVNLMAVDAQKLQETPVVLHILWISPVIIIVAIVFLWQELGVSALAGVFVMFIIIPVNGLVASKIKKLQAHQIKLRDQRVKLMNEILSGIRVLKMYAWEESFQTKVTEIRQKELVILRRTAFMNATSAVTWFCAPFLVALCSFAAYVLSSPENDLTSDKAFVSLSLFNIMNQPLSLMPSEISRAVEFLVSLARFDRFLTEEELDRDLVNRTPWAPNAIQIDNGTFFCDPDCPPSLKNINLTIPDGKLYAIVGTVECGKSSLINSILGELHKSEGSISVKGSVAYVPQQAWCLNCSLQDNILFGKEMQRSRYQSVLSACCLHSDLKGLAAGDKTEIGEKGIKFSRGQKQRVSLARAVYQDSDIYLLDDPLSAVDAHVGKQLFEKVISNNGMLGGKTRVLVTDALTFLSKVDCIVVMNNGTISEMGTYQELLSRDESFSGFIRTYLEQDDDDDYDDEELSELEAELRMGIERRSESELDTETGRQSSRRSRKSSHFQTSSTEMIENLEQQEQADSKMMSKESYETGNVRLAVFLMYFKDMTLPVIIIIIISYFGYVGNQVSTNLWLSLWSEDKSASNNTATRDLYLGVYGALGACQIVFIIIQSLTIAVGTFYASRAIHCSILKNILRVPMSFFDTTPLGRILNRFGKDVDIVDIDIPNTVGDWLRVMSTVNGTIVVISIATPPFLIAFVPLSICYFFGLMMYSCTARQLKRIDSIKRSPIYSHFQESIVGATSIRAYGRQQDFIETSDSLVDDNQRIWYPTVICTRWISVALQSLGNVIILLAAIFAVVSRDAIGPGLAGASISYSLQVTSSFTMVVRMTCDLDNCTVALERILKYAKLSTEAAPYSVSPPPQEWPSQGRVEFRNYSVRYRSGPDLVLRRINALVNPGERVGIVGRTWTGKSSLALGLFRILEPASGEILIDGTRITDVGLTELRSRLTIIPQEPVLFSGTLRMNLDPFDLISDDDLLRVLDQAHLKAFVTNLPDGLQHECSEGGENLSVGQRHLVCLARALLRKTRILVLEEATAAVDLETDNLIQNTIRREFKGCTILTIAHRLNTILDYDRVMVLDRGEVIEMDSPSMLLYQKSSAFYGMCRDAGLV